MKNLRILLAIFLPAVVLTACDENEIMPAYQKKGTTTNTIATITSSDTRPIKLTDITITLKYVNPASDPLQTVEVKAKVGSGAYTTVQTFDVQSDPLDAESTRSLTYTTPDASGTVTFDMVIMSKAPYPQIKRTTVTVQ